MNLALNPKKKSSNGLQQFFQTSWRENKPLLFTGLFSIALLLFTVVGLLVDTRTILGEPVWIKPTKFAISSVFYSLTLMWMLTFVTRRTRWISIISWVTAVAMFVELVLIALQAFRGVRSHFNVATPFDMAVFSTMGTMILLLWLVSLAALVLLIRQPFENRAWGLSLKLALVITVVGTGLGFLMTSPNAQQLATAEATGVMLEAGGHSVGVADGGAGLPFVGWSTEGGDLRVGHFIGMHAMQVLPLLGYVIVRQNSRLSGRKQSQLIGITGAGYLAFVGLVTWQALRAEPLIYPGPLTLTALGVLIAAVAGGSIWVLLRRDQLA